MIKEGSYFSDKTIIVLRFLFDDVVGYDRTGAVQRTKQYMARYGNGASVVHRPPSGLVPAASLLAYLLQKTTNSTTTTNEREFKILDRIVFFLFRVRALFFLPPPLFCILPPRTKTVFFILVFLYVPFIINKNIRYMMNDEQEVQQ